MNVTFDIKWIMVVVFLATVMQNLMQIKYDGEAGLICELNRSDWDLFYN